MSSTRTHVARVSLVPSPQVAEQGVSEVTFQVYGEERRDKVEDEDGDKDVDEDEDEDEDEDDNEDKDEDRDRDRLRHDQVGVPTAPET